MAKDDAARPSADGVQAAAVGGRTSPDGARPIAETGHTIIGYNAAPPFSFTPRTMFAVVAIAAYWGFIFAAYWGTPYLAGGGEGLARTYGELSALVGQCVGFIVISLFGDRLSTKRGLDALIVGAVVLCPLGAIPSFMHLAGLECPLPLLSVCMFLLACGHACMLCRLGTVLESLTGPLMGIALAIATLISCGIFVGVVALPFAAQTVALFLLPWLCCACVVPTRPEASLPDRDLAGARMGECANPKASSDFKWFLAQLFFFSFSFCLVQAAGSDIVGTSTATGLYWISIFLSGAVLLVYGVFINRYISPQTIMWFLLPLAAIGFIPLSVASQDGRLACWVIVSFGFTLFDMLGLFNLSSFIRYNGLSVNRYFPLGRLSGAIALVIGWVVGSFISPGETTKLVYISFILVLVLIVLMCAYIWKLTREVERVSRGDEKVDEDEDGASARQAEEPVRSWSSICKEAGDRFGLSPREREVFYFLADGQTARSISDRLFTSISTTKTHIHRIYQKTGVGSQHELLDLIHDDYGIEDEHRPYSQ